MSGGDSTVPTLFRKVKGLLNLKRNNQMLHPSLLHRGKAWSVDCISRKSSEQIGRRSVLSANCMLRSSQRVKVLGILSSKPRSVMSATVEETVEKKMSELTVEKKAAEETVEKQTTEETAEETTKEETVEKAVTQETSETVKHSLDEEEDGCNEEEDAGKVVPLPIVTSSILAKVIEYCKKHVESSKSEDGVAKDALKEWDTDFVNVDLDTLYHLIMVSADFMNVKGLLRLTCRRVADIIHGKTPEEIRQSFGIQNDFTPEEEEEIKKQNQWAYCD
ncbi:SKP1-like protein [Drosera capensis]